MPRAVTSHSSGRARVGRRRYRRHRNTRGLAMLDDKIFHLSVDNHLIAVDARSGSLVWETLENDARGH